MITDDPMFMAELAAAKREEQDARWRKATDSPTVTLWAAMRWHAEYHGGRFEDCPAPTCSGEVPA